MTTPSEKPPFRTFKPTLLTGLFLPADAPVPDAAPLPDAPVPNPNLRLPTGGVSLLYGINAPGLMGQALHRAQRQGWRAIGARVTTRFNRVQASGRQLTPELLSQVEVLWLNKLYTGREVAEAVQHHVVRYLADDGHPLLKPEPPLSFADLGNHPYLLPRLLAEPAFRHLRAVVIVLPGVPLKDDLRPAAQMMFVRDLTALQSLQVDYGAPTGQPVFRLPTAEDVAQPRTTLNPFAATLPKPNVVYIRVGPVG